MRKELFSEFKINFRYRENVNLKVKTEKCGWKMLNDRVLGRGYLFRMGLDIQRGHQFG